MSVAAFGNRPAIFTRIALNNPEEAGQSFISHVVRLHSRDSARIGIAELQAAFPDLLANCPDERSVLARIMSETSEFVGEEVHLSIETQMDKNTGKPSKNPRTGEAYFNVRLRNALTDIDEGLALQLADRALSHQDEDMNLADRVTREFGAQG